MVRKSVKRNISKSKSNSNSNNVKNNSSKAKVQPTKLSKDKLSKDAFYCVKCRALCFSRKLDIVDKKTKKGQPYVSGKCTNTLNGNECGTKVNRFVKKTKTQKNK